MHNVDLLEKEPKWYSIICAKRRSRSTHEHRALLCLKPGVQTCATRFSSVDLQVLGALVGVLRDMGDDIKIQSSQQLWKVQHFLDGFT